MSKKSTIGAELGERLLQAVRGMKSGASARETVHTDPDAFAVECRRQSRSLCDDAQEAEILSELERVADRDEWIGED